jgi:hypothetical protein
LGAYRIPPETGLLIPSDKRGVLGKWLSGLIQKGNILKKEGPGFVRGMQTRDRGVRQRQGRNKLDFHSAKLLAGLPSGKAGITPRT